MIRVRTIENGPLKQNCYIVSLPENKAIIIDPGSDADGIVDLLGQLRVEPLFIIGTHGHFDHVGAVKDLQDYFNILFYLHNKDHALLRRANLYRLAFRAKETIKIPKHVSDVPDTKILRVGSTEINLIQTPGHTEGSICIKVSDVMFTGDTMVASGPGPSDLPGGNKALLEQSIASLKKNFSGKTLCYPGHGSPFKLKDLSCEVNLFLEKNV